MGGLKEDEAPAAPGRHTMNATFEQLGKRYLDEVTALSPVSATSLGDHRFDAELDEVSPEAKQRKAAFCGSSAASIPPSCPGPTR